MTHSILRIDASADTKSATSRKLLDAIVAKLGGTVTRRDLADTPPQAIDLGFVTGRGLPEGERDDAQTVSLAPSQELIAELEAADTIVIGMPIYNFGVPSALKAWADQVAVPKRTFGYTADGPHGLLSGKRAIIAVTSGGTKVDSDIDFATPWMRFFLGFIGITDVTVIAADQLMMESVDKLKAAQASIDALAA